MAGCHLVVKAANAFQEGRICFPCQIWGRLGRISSACISNCLMAIVPGGRGKGWVMTVCSLLVLFVLRFLSCSRRSQTLRRSCCGRGWGGGLRSCAGCLLPDPAAWWVRAAPEVGCVCLGRAWPCWGHRQQRLQPPELPHLPCCLLPAAAEAPFI